MASSPSPDSAPSTVPPPSTTPPPSSATPSPPTALPSPPSTPVGSPPPLNDVPPPSTTPPPQVTAPLPQPSNPPESSPSPPARPPPERVPSPAPPQPPQRSPSPPDNPPPPEPSNPGKPPPQRPVVPSPERPPLAPPLSPVVNSSSSGEGNSSSPPSSGPPGSTSPPQPPQTVPSPPNVQFPPPQFFENSPPSSQSPVTPSDKPSARETSNSNDDGGVPGGVLAIGIVSGVILLAIVGLAFWISCNRRRRKRPDPSGGYFMPLSYRPGFNGGHVMPASHGSLTQSDLSHSKTHSPAPTAGSHSESSNLVYSSSESGGSHNLKPRFTYEELYKATNGFSAHNLLGEGGFGSVYKGYLPDGKVVAVKHLKVGGGQGEREFKAEVEIISRIHHRHLVSIVGYCISQDQRLLVYDYVPNNTLHFHLHGEGIPVLNWAIRFKVAAGAARGIAYLHEDCHPRIVHRDIKSSNILLDDNFEARVSDFGLAKLFLDANTHVTTRVMGTFGYMAPEYASSGKLTEKSDVFSFGVVLLELITGRKPVDTSQPAGTESLVELARPLLSRALDTEDFENLIDPKLGKNYIKSEVLRMIETAAACIRHSAAKRPRMGQIVRTFDTLAPIDLSNGMKPGESEVHNGAPQSSLVRVFHRMAQGGQDSSSDFFSGDSLNTRGSL